MRPSLTARVAAIADVLTCALVQAHATSEHTYKKNEYLFIERGRAPNKLLSIASHGKGEAGRDDFHLYLMAEPAHRKITQLPGIGPDDVLDTGPDAYRARWTPDRRHRLPLRSPHRPGAALPDWQRSCANHPCSRFATPGHQEERADFV